MLVPDWPFFECQELITSVIDTIYSFYWRKMFFTLVEIESFFSREFYFSNFCPPKTPRPLFKWYFYLPRLFSFSWLIYSVCHPAPRFNINPLIFWIKKSLYNFSRNWFPTPGSPEFSEVDWSPKTANSEVLVVHCWFLWEGEGKRNVNFPGIRGGGT